MKEKRTSKYNIKNSNKGSRKWALVLSVFWISTLMLLVPPLLSVWLFGAEKPMIILTGVEYVSLVSLSVGSYFGANVFQKNVELRRVGGRVETGSLTEEEEDTRRDKLNYEDETTEDPSDEEKEA